MFRRPFIFRRSPPSCGKRTLACASSPKRSSSSAGSPNRNPRANRGNSQETRAGPLISHPEALRKERRKDLLKRAEVSFPNRPSSGGESAAIKSILVPTKEHLPPFAQMSKFSSASARYSRRRWAICSRSQRAGKNTRQRSTSGWAPASPLARLPQRNTARISRSSPAFFRIFCTRGSPKISSALRLRPFGVRNRALRKAPANTRENLPRSPDAAGPVPPWPPHSPVFLPHRSAGPERRRHKAVPLGRGPARRR